MKNCLYIIITGLLALTRCHQPPELPVTPMIKFEDVQFKEVDGPDSLIVSIYFEDGDGDLGLTPYDVNIPYQAYDVVLDENNDTVTYGSRPGQPTYNPIDYVITRDEDGVAQDTVQVKINENHYNYFVRFFTKLKGQYTEFKWRDAPYYQTFDGRFPLLNTDIVNNRLKEKPLEGTLKYGMTSSGWLLLFRDTMKITVQIQDRSLHKSNVVESPDFTLESIKIPAQ